MSLPDPEDVYHTIGTGDPVSLRGHVDVLDRALTTLDDAQTTMQALAVAPRWRGLGSVAYRTRATSIATGISADAMRAASVRSLVNSALGAYEVATENADRVISLWRTIGDSWMGHALQPYVVQALNDVRSTYNSQLHGLLAMTPASGLDLDDLDEETREWVEDGLAQTDDWLDDHDGVRGPMIPNTKATGDHRGLIPQGMTYDPTTGLLMQIYYDKDGNSVVAMIDPRTGQEVADVDLGGFTDPSGDTHSTPGHAGGITVIGDTAYATHSSPPQLVPYSVDGLQGAGNGGTVNASGTSIDLVEDGTPGVDYPERASYTATDDQGRLYVGDHGNSRLFIYEKRGGEWVQVDHVDTPERSQGVIVRDGEYVFTSSLGRTAAGSSELIVTDKYGNEIESIDLPYMAQSTVELDGRLLTTYESGAAEYDHIDGVPHWGWLWGVDDNYELWANPYMTSIPIEELGLEGELEMDPTSLTITAADMTDAESDLRTTARSVDGITLQGSQLGTVPSALPLATQLVSMLDITVRNLRTRRQAVRLVSDGLVVTAQGHVKTDDAVAAHIRRNNPR